MRNRPWGRSAALPCPLSVGMALALAVGAATCWRALHHAGTLPQSPARKNDGWQERAGQKARTTAAVQEEVGAQRVGSGQGWFKEGFLRGAVGKVLG